jgi:hypothetical protein
MEFLTPEEKRWRTVRFITGYILIAIAILLATFIAALLVQGYQITNRNSIVQNGLVNVASQPVSAEVLLNGQKVDNTPSRLDINEGTYELRLQANNYRSWQKSFNLPGGSVRYFVYPKLIPNNISLSEMTTFEKTPLWASSSPDRHWVVSKQPTDNSVSFSVFDTTKASSTNETGRTQQISIPQTTLVGTAGAYGNVEPVEWSDDNRHLLLLQTLPTGEKAYIVLDREKPENSQNITKLFGLSASQSVALRDKKFNKFYILAKDTGQLTSRDSKDLNVNENIAESVVSYKSYGNDIVAYVTYQNALETEAKVVVKENQKNIYYLQSIKRNPDGRYLIDMAKYDGDWFYAVSSPVENRVRLFINPLSSNSPGSSLQIKPKLSIPIESPKFISFSDNARFIMAQNANNFAVYDGELKTTYRYSLVNKIAETQEVKWMDGHRLKFVDSFKGYIVEFDGTNQQELITSLPNNSFNMFFDRDYEFVFAYQSDAAKNSLQAGSLVAQ